MLKVIGRRLALAIPLLIVISTLAFFLVSMIPGDPVVALLGPDASAEDYAAVRAELGLDRPMVVQYFDWMFGVFQGDMGNSIRTGRPVATTIIDRLPVTASLAVIAIIATAIIGTALGLVSALRGGAIGKVAQVGSVVGTSLPNFWLGILLVLLFAVMLKWLPATGYVPFERSASEWAESLILPVVAITVAAVAAIARQTRSAMNDVLGRDFIRTLLATGTSRNRVIFRHALRNAAIPVVTSLSFQFINLLSGAVVIETVFTLPGLGQLLVVAISARDIPVVQGVVIVTAILVIIVNLIVDLVNAWLNPKVRT